VVATPNAELATIQTRMREDVNNYCAGRLGLLTEIMELHNYVLNHVCKVYEKIMKTAPGTKLFVILATATTLAQPMPCQVATAVLPWDQTLTAIQDMLISTVAPAAIALGFAGAAMLYALGGCDKQAGRLAGSAIGCCIAIGIVHLLNYALP
jgi:hypothetical protein